MNHSINYTLYTPAPPSTPFTTFAPKAPATITAARLGKHNFDQMTYRILVNSGLAMFIPADRNSLTVGNEEFVVGEWIVEESVASKLSLHYRHPTDNEAAAYGLTQLELKG